ncbi:hypothetical protein [Croceimicrobium sp.]|uniref:hypothetical protein n=1 Tax=Croceimicrobium sp. TaxID=2828340 RepID=UPI003BA99F91
MGISKKTLILLIATLCLQSCSKSKLPQESQSNSIKELDQILVDLTTKAEKKIDPMKDQMLKVSAYWNPATRELSIEKTEITQINFFPIDLIRKGKAIEEGDTYNVDCCCDSNGDLLWSKTCDGKFSCGSKIADCLDNGGCAEICTASISILPPSSSSDGLLIIQLDP